MSNEKFFLSLGDVSTTVHVDLEPLADGRYVGPKLCINSTAFGHKMNGYEVLTDTDSIRELGHFLVEMADKYDDMPDGTYKEYVEVMKQWS